MTALEEAWLDLREVYVAIDTRRKGLGLSWNALAAAQGDIAPSTIARFARDQVPIEADGVFGLLDWLGLPAETFVRNRREAGISLADKVANVIRTHSEIPAQAAAEIQGSVTEALTDRKGKSQQSESSDTSDMTFAPGFTRIDALALHAALDERRQDRSLTWADITREMGFPLPGMFAGHARPAAPKDRGRQGLGGRQEAHYCLAMAHWLGVPVETFLRRLMGRQRPSTGLPAQIGRLVQSHPGLSLEASAALEKSARAACERVLAGATGSPSAMG